MLGGGIKTNDLQLCVFELSNQAALNVTSTSAHRRQRATPTSWFNLLTKQSSIALQARTDIGCSNEGTCSSVLAWVHLTLSHNVVCTCISSVAVCTAAGVVAHTDTKFTRWTANHCIKWNKVNNNTVCGYLCCVCVMYLLYVCMCV